MSGTDIQSKRPLSPHLTIYKPIPTMVMSIAHRITGAALYFGTVLVVWWLVAAASGKQYYDWLNSLYTSPFFLLVFFLYSWTLLHHMVGGIRHFAWDMGHGFDKEMSTKMAWGTLIVSFAATVVLWLIGLAV